jgi:hypothetical protein
MVDHSQSGKVYINQYTDLVHLVTVASGRFAYSGLAASCASPGFFYTANTPADNTTAERDVQSRAGRGPHHRLKAPSRLQFQLARLARAAGRK